jgi:hypothetical protein
MKKNLFGLIQAILYLCILASCKMNVEDKWFFFSDNETKGSNINVVYKTSALFDSDIKLPDILNISGKAKFLQHGDNSKNSISIGYLIDIQIASLDKTKIPKKYKGRKIPTRDGDIEVLPLEQVTYEISSEIQLLDKDGFEIKTMKTPSHYIKSGKINNIQSKTNSMINYDQALLVKDMKLIISIDKCVSCQ